MAIKSDAQRRAVAKYNLENYERIELRVETGLKDRIKAHAAKHDKGSVNGFLKRAIRETMERDEHAGDG